MPLFGYHAHHPSPTLHYLPGTSVLPFPLPQDTGHFKEICSGGERKGDGPTYTLILALLASGAVREEMSVVLSHPSCGALLQQLQETDIRAEKFSR